MNMNLMPRVAAQWTRRALGLLPTIVLTSCLSSVSYGERYSHNVILPPTSLEEAQNRLNEAATAIGPETASSQGNSPTTHTNQETSLGLSLRDAIVMAMENNMSLKVQSFAPEIAETAIAEARAAFDPQFALSMNYSEKKNPGVEASANAYVSSGTQTGTLTGGTAEAAELVTSIQQVLSQVQKLGQLLQEETDSVTETKGLNASATLTQPLPTGTELYVSSSYGRIADDAREDKEYSGEWSVGVAQSLLRGFGSKVNLVPLRRSRNETLANEMAFRHYLIQLAARVELAYWELALAQETTQIRRLSLNLAEEQLKLNEALISVGKLAGSARFSAEAEVAAQKALLVDAESSLQSRALELWQLINPRGWSVEDVQLQTIAIPESEMPTLSARESAALALLFRCDLAQARLEAANGELAVLQTKNGLLPDLTAFLSYGAVSSGSSSGSWNRNLDDATYSHFQAGISLNIALGNRAEKARYRRAKLQKAQAEAAVKAMEQLIEVETRAAAIEVSRQQEQIAASRMELISRQEELAVETEQFRLGRSTNLNVLQVQQKFVQAKIQEAAARARFQQALTTLYQTEGALLTRRGIVVSGEKETRS